MNKLVYPDLDSAVKSLPAAMPGKVDMNIEYPSIDRRLNSFAYRSFRDPADGDYISARMCCRVGLTSQFHWSALQAIEKYGKTILLLNRIKAKRIGHSLSKLIGKLDELSFDVQLSESTRTLIEHLDGLGQYRYLEVPYYSIDRALLRLDRGVWEIRRYCTTMDNAVSLATEGAKSSLTSSLARIERSEREQPTKCRLSRGLLENIVDGADSDLRRALVWQNAYFGRVSRRRVRIPRKFEAVNAPLSLDLDLLDEVSNYVHIPAEVRAGYESLKRTRQ